MGTYLTEVRTDSNVLVVNNQLNRVNCQPIEIRYKGREPETKVDRQKHKQTDRQTKADTKRDRQIGTQTGRQTGRHTERQTDRLTDGQTDR